MSKPVLLIIPVLAVAIIVPAVLLPFAHTSAAQTPKMSLDMVTTGNTYDSTTNTMTVGGIEPCLSTDAPGDDNTHAHDVHIVIQNVEDLIGWQARLGYDGGKIRPLDVNFTPFVDSKTGQNISFVNLPLDPLTGVHRELVSASDIPPPGPGPQNALIGSAYIGDQSAAVSPDTPAKSPPDDLSYSAPSGGVLASVKLEVPAGNAGQLLSIDLSSAPHPGSKVVVFTGGGVGEEEIDLSDTDLSGGLHAEGVPCPAPTTEPAPTAPGGGTSTGASTSSAFTGTGSPTGTPAGGTARPSNAGTARPSSTGTATPSSQGADGGGLPTWAYFLLVGGLATVAASAIAVWRLRWRPRRGEK